MTKFHSRLFIVALNSDTFVIRIKKKKKKCRYIVWGLYNFLFRYKIVLLLNVLSIELLYFILFY